MRLCLLDFDGVINNPSSWTPSRAADIQLCIPHERACIERVNEVVRRSGAKIVISSSWRMFTSYEYLAPALHRHGLVADVIGETPRTEVARELLLEYGYDLDDALPYHFQRGMDIWAWLLTHPLAVGVTEIGILDDSDDMWRLKPCLVHVHGAAGLQDHDVEAAIALFESSRPYVQAIHADRARLGL